jgi:nucleoside recognition membrane protein YjiH
MIPLTALWLPILLSAVIVFFASFIIHMVLGYHKSDYRKLPDEDRVTDAMRNAGVTRGSAYFFPYFSFKEMKSPPVIEKMRRGPVGLLTVLPSGPPAMGKNMVQWFLYCLVISIFAAYLYLSCALEVGTASWQVFRVVGTVAFLGYGAAHAQESIWNGRSWVVTLKHLFDSLIYAVLTAGIFGWLWPKSL